MNRYVTKDMEAINMYSVNGPNYKIDSGLTKIPQLGIAGGTIYKCYCFFAFQQHVRITAILDNALAAVGRTPLLRLDKIAEANGLQCNLCEPHSQLVYFAFHSFFVVAKVEFMSAGGSVKDRIAKAMVEAAEKEGKLIPQKSVVIEPTSGNTGILFPHSTSFFSPYYQALVSLWLVLSR
jgi:hypothetical protein